MMLSRKRLAWVWGGLALAVLIAMIHLLHIERGMSAGTEERHPAGPLRELAFATSSDGWAALTGAEGEILLATHDGGLTWSKLPTPPPFHKLFFVDSSRGWGLSGTVGNSSSTTLWRTSNGGKTWASTELGSAAGVQHGDEIVDLWFASERHAVFLSRQHAGSGAVYFTGDGGRTVRQVESISAIGTTRALFGDRNGNIWLLASSAIWHSASTGVLWMPQLTTANRPTGKAGLTANAGVALGSGRIVVVGERSGGSILLSDNYGGNWRTVLQTDDLGYFSDVSFVDGGYGCAVGSSVVIYCSEDGGVSWKRWPVLPSSKLGNTHPASRFDRIVLTSRRHGFAVAAIGNLYETEDGGNSWRETDLTPPRGEPERRR